MTEDRGICDLAVVSLQDSEPEAEMEDGESHAYHRGEKDSKQPEGTTKHPFNGGMDNVNVSGHSVTLTSTNNPKSEIEPSTLKTCVDHDSELDSFCSSEGKLICSLCAISGPCQGHTVTALATQATAVRVSDVLRSARFNLIKLTNSLAISVKYFLETKVNEEVGWGICLGSY